MTPSPSPRPQTARAVGSYSGSSFYWALKLLPVEKRRAMFAVYGFCRAVDDIADGTATPGQKQDLLTAYRTDVGRLFTGDTPHMPVVADLRPVVDTYHIQKADLLAVIDGMETDAHDAVRIPDGAAFDAYLDRVACAVGRLSDKVFGLHGPQADRLAYHLGRALQITNILRDLDEDAARDRLYLPADLLARHGIATDDPSAALDDPRVVHVLEVLAEQAEACYRRAEDALGHLERAKTRPARMMMAVYREILANLRRRGLVNRHVPVRLGKWRKLWLAVRHGVLA